MNSGDPLIDDLFRRVQAKHALAPRLAQQTPEFDLYHWLRNAAALQTYGGVTGNDLRAIYDALTDELPNAQEILRRWHGAFGFLCFQSVAEDEVGGLPVTVAEANQFLNEPTILECIDLCYKIGSTFHPKGCTLHRTGTTSYILKAEADDGDYAIKILKSRYLSYSKIANATHDYKEHYGRLAGKGGGIAPRIFHSSERCIVMEFIDGDTLGEAIAKRVLEKIQVRLEVLQSLAEALQRCARLKVAHCDLSPSNIILIREMHPVTHADDEEERESFRPVLIDFGFNYVLYERTGGARALIERERYIAPELLSNPEGAAALADVYSLGILLIDVLRVRDPDEYRDVGYDLDRLWTEFPEIAPLVEDMVDRDPNNRLLDMPSHNRQTASSEELHDYIIRELRLRARLHLKLKKESKSTSSGRTLWLLFSQMVAGPSFEELFAEIKRAVTLDPGKRALTIRSIKWVSLSTILHLVVVVIFVLKLKPDKWYENIEGRVVAVSFSIVAAQYYARIFATLVAIGVSRTTEWAIRSTSFLPWLPILYALVWEPKTWPICSAIGVGFITFNNWLAARTVAEAESNRERKFKLPKSDLGPFLNRMGSWWTTMLVYCFCLIGIGVLLRFGFASDERVYAAVVVTVNLFILGYQACGKDGPLIKGGLLRSFVLLRRTKRRNEIYRGAINRSTASI
jgi:serine/threonine protein kinase